jgi:hypothetical protein
MRVAANDLDEVSVTLKAVLLEAEMYHAVPK